MQTVAAGFTTQTAATVRQPKFKVKIAWERTTTSGTFAEIDTSTIDGDDLVQGESSVVMPLDQFEYTDESDYVLSLEWEREADEPLGGLSVAQATVVLENTTKRFTPDQDATIGSYILKNRPIQIFVGFQDDTVERLIPIFKGLISEIEENKHNRTVRIQAVDYVRYLLEIDLNSSVYTDDTSDTIIEDILSDASFGSSQYSLDTGLNTIDFGWFKKGDKAGERIRTICEAEEGHFFQDEFGLLRFHNRRKYNSAPYTSSQYTFTDVKVSGWENDKSTRIVNKAEVNAEPREVQGTSEVYRMGIAEVFPRGETTTIWADFEDPVTAISTITANTDYTFNSAEDGSGVDLTALINITATLFTETVKLEIENTSGQDVYATYFRIRGTPATVTSEIKEIYQDDTSISEHNENTLDITNDFIDTEQFAYYLSRTLVRKYKDPIKKQVLDIPAVPQLQLKDKITLTRPEDDTDEYYRILGIRGRMDTASGFTMQLRVREITDLEADTLATIDSSTIDGDDVLGV